MESIPLDVDYFLGLKTEFGFPVRSLKMKNDHFLVYKIPMKESSEGKHGVSISLPDQYRKRAVGNMVTIKGLVISASDAYYSKHTTKSWYFDYKQQRELPKWAVRRGALIESQIKPGMCILYNSFNVGKVEVTELLDPLVIVRGVDVEALFSVEDVHRIDIGDHAMRASPS